VLNVIVTLLLFMAAGLNTPGSKAAMARLTETSSSASPCLNRERTPLAPGSALPLYALLPVCLMLLGIAVFPLWLPHWWESNRNKLLMACALGLAILGLYLRRRPGALVAMGEELGVRQPWQFFWATGASHPP
jgi:Putative citrate transport